MEQIIANTRSFNTGQAFARAPREALEHIQSLANFRLDEAMLDLAIETGGTQFTTTRKLIERLGAERKLVQFADAVAAALLRRANQERRTAAIEVTSW